MTAEGINVLRTLILIGCILTFSAITIRVFNRKSKGFIEFFAWISTVPVGLFALCA